MLGLHTGLHGSTSYLTRSLSFAWSRSKHATVAPAISSILSPHCYRCPVGLTYPKCELQCLKTSLELADANFTSQPAAFIGEPVLSAGGVIVPPPGYYQALREACDKRGMLMIFDESQTGLGKTGQLFGFQHEAGVMPDIITISKHFGGGLPISAVCTTDEIAERAVNQGYFATRSHAADPILCAAGEESLHIVIEEDMAGKAARIEQRLHTALRSMAEEFELIGDIRGRGVLVGIEFVTDREKKTPANAEVGLISQYCLEHGLIFQLRGTQGDLNVIRLVPPMTNHGSRSRSRHVDPARRDRRRDALTRFCVHAIPAQPEVRTPSWRHQDQRFGLFGCATAIVDAPVAIGQEQHAQGLRGPGCGP